MSTDITLLASKKNALLLGAFASVCTAIVSITYVLTADTIARQEQQQTLAKITEVLNPKRFDNNPLENCVMVSAPDITGSEEVTPIYRATLQNEPYALVFQTQTKKGYNGLIKLIAAVDAESNVQGVRTLNHKETPGLGDKIELKKSDWILTLTDKTIRDANDKKWFVKKDGGDFDQFTGATITPRALINQIRLSGFEAHQQFSALFDLPNDCALPVASSSSESVDPQLTSETDLTTDTELTEGQETSAASELEQDNDNS